MRPVRVRKGSNNIISKIMKNGVEIKSVFKNDYYLFIQNLKEIFIYDDKTHKLYQTYISPNGKYNNLVDVSDNENYFTYIPGDPYVQIDSTDRKEWVLSTQSRHSDMSTWTTYMSNSNYYVNNGVAWMKIKWSSLTSLTIKYGSYGEGSFDYVQVWQMDREFTSFTNLNTSSGSSTSPTASYPLLTTHGKLNSSAPNLSYTFTCDENEHFIWVSYRKDGSVNANEDRGYIAIESELLKDNTIISFNVPYYIISQDSYIIENGKYYEKLIYSVDNKEIKGNELPLELGEKELIVLNGKRYNCNYYYYVLPNGDKIKTDNYILGEENKEPAITSYVYIDITKASGLYTGVYPTVNTRMEVYAHDIIGQGGVNIGCYDLADSEDWRFFKTSGSAGTGTYYYDCHNGRCSTNVNSTYGRNLLFFDCRNGSFTIKDYNTNYQIYRGTMSAQSWSGQKSQQIQIHAVDINQAGQTASGYSGYYHRIKIYEGDNLIRDYVPWQYGEYYVLYDLVNDTIMTPTTGHITTGLIE